MDEIICKFCNKSFNTKSYLVRHQNTAKYCIEIQKNMDVNKTVNMSDDELDKLKKDNEVEKLKKEIEKLKNPKVLEPKEDNEVEKLKKEIEKLKEQKVVEPKEDNEVEKLKKEIEKLKEPKVLEPKEDNEVEKLKKEIEKLKEQKVLEPKEDNEVEKLKKEIEKLKEPKVVEPKEDNEVEKLKKEIEKLKQENLNLKVQKIEEKIDNKQKSDDHQPKVLYDNFLTKITNKIYDHLKLSLVDQKLTISNITYIIVDLMKFIENYQIENSSKKEIIISIIEKYIFQNVDNIENVDVIKIFIESIPNLIDIYKSIDTKKITIKLKKIRCFFPLCS